MSDGIDSFFINLFCIIQMMDLGTVKRKLERNQYKNASECAEDIRQIWANCKAYNADDSDFYFLAESFSEKFEERYRKIQADCKYTHLCLTWMMFPCVSLIYNTYF